MKIGYFPGCSLLGSSREYDESMRASAKAIGLDLQEIPDWNCCGASAAHNLNHMLSIALPARSLALAEKAGLDEILVPCSACYSRLLSANAELAGDAELREKVSGIIEMEVKGTSKILNVIEALEKVITGDIKEKIVSHFDYKVACYYGCYLVRPPKLVQPDRVEDPQGMDAIMKKIGAEPIDWAFKVECCGAGFSVSQTDLVGKLSGKIVEDAVDRGAEAIIVACPMCHSNLDLRRPAIEKFTGKKYDIPVMFITQAIGLAMGLDEKTLGLHRHMVTVKLPSKEAAPASYIE